MDPGMSRTRLIRPEFFEDETMACAHVATRLFYIGLWTLCDDAGYFDLKPRQIAASLFPYDGPARRERMVAKALDELVGLGRVKYLDCGLHATVPTLPKHGVKGGNKAETVRSRHATVCLSVHVRTGTDKSSSVSVSESVSDSVSEGAQARGLRDVSKDVGGFAASLARRVPA